MTKEEITKEDIKKIKTLIRELINVYRSYCLSLKNQKNCLLKLKVSEILKDIIPKQKKYQEKIESLFLEINKFPESNKYIEKKQSELLQSLHSESLVLLNEIKILIDNRLEVYNQVIGNIKKDMEKTGKECYGYNNNAKWSNKNSTPNALINVNNN